MQLALYNLFKQEISTLLVIIMLACCNAPPACVILFPAFISPVLTLLLSLFPPLCSLATCSRGHPPPMYVAIPMSITLISVVLAWGAPGTAYIFICGFSCCTVDLIYIHVDGVGYTGWTRVVCIHGSVCCRGGRFLTKC